MREGVTDKGETQHGDVELRVSTSKLELEGITIYKQLALPGF